MSGIRLILDDGMSTVGSDEDTKLPCPRCNGVERAAHNETETTYRQIGDCYLCKGIGAVSSAVRIGWVRRQRESMARKLAAG